MKKIAALLIVGAAALTPVAVAQGAHQAPAASPTEAVTKVICTFNGWTFPGFEKHYTCRRV